MIFISRIIRNNLKTSFFHVMIQGINKEYIFGKKRYKQKYFSIIQRNKREFDITIMAYCIMSNHVHMLIKTEKVQNLSKFMQKTSSLYAKYYNYMENRVGYVFRDRFKSEPIINKKYLVRCIKYIHQNPVKAKMVKNEKDYLYSSYQFYQKHKDNKILTREEVEYICSSNDDIPEIFLDIDRNPEEIINEGLKEFLKKENIKIFEIFEKDDILKKLIKYLKVENNVKYTEMMKRFGITRGTMERLKK